MFPDVEDAIPFEQDAIENKMNPLLRIALQQARGEGNFGNKIVEKGEEAGWNEITMGQRLGEIAQDLNPFMPNLVNTYLQTKERQEVQSEFYEAVFNAYKRHQEQKENSRKAISF